MILNNNEHTGSKSNLELALRWKEDCLQNHAAVCGSVSGSSAPKLPKRVINVNLSPPALHISNGEAATYAILSHCWGKNKVKPIRTTAENLKDRCTSIPWELIPKTFKDAIEVTRTLKLKYLWIDSLCIIQKSVSGVGTESSKDWLEESLKMGDYYGNATITIGATSAIDDTERCFLKRNPISTLPCDILVKFPDRTQVEQLVSWLSDTNGPTYHWSLPHRRRGRTNAPLVRRAWCLQESTMSTRILNFEAEQITWECLAGQANEIFPAARVLPGTYLGVNPSLRNMIARSRIATNEREPRSHPYYFQPITGDVQANEKLLEDIWEAWRQLVEDVSQREIYTGWDLLPGISGISISIQLMLKLPEECYIAGIWETDLTESLLWVTQVPDTPPGTQPLKKQPRRSGRSPSWS